jgi:hypothetical protein
MIAYRLMVSRLHKPAYHHRRNPAVYGATIADSRQIKKPRSRPASLHRHEACLDCLQLCEDGLSNPRELYHSVAPSQGSRALSQKLLCQLHTLLQLSGHPLRIKCLLVAPLVGQRHDMQIQLVELHAWSAFWQHGLRAKDKQGQLPQKRPQSVTVIVHRACRQDCQLPHPRIYPFVHRYRVLHQAGAK